MRRRDFLAAVGVASAFPGFALAQEARKGRDGRLPLIGALVNATKAQSDMDTLGPFLKGMINRGYVQDRDYSLTALYDNGDITLQPSFAKELIALSPELILVSTGNATTVVAAETKAIPILSPAISAGVIPTLVGNMARPTGNVTGLLTDFASLTGKHCDLALDLVPAAKRIGVLIFVDSSDAGAARKVVNDAASARKFIPLLIDVKQPADIASGFRALAEAKADVAVVGSGGVFASDRGRTAAAAAAVKMPAIYNEQGYVEAGGLMSYGFDRKAAMVRTADFAVRILAGAKPSDLPVEQTQSYFMAINRSTAASLGLTFGPNILSRVDETV